MAAVASDGQACNDEDNENSPRAPWLRSRVRLGEICALMHLETSRVIDVKAMGRE